MTSSLYLGTVVHARFAPVRHAFRYPVVFAAIDLDDLPAIGKTTRLFGHNRRRPMALFDADYLTEGRDSLRVKLASVLAARATFCSLAKVVLVTAPRIWRRVFNPVSFYYCFDANETLECVVAEVNNTFGERHVYILDRPDQLGGSIGSRFSTSKTFHVSPFFERSGSYRFSFSPIGPKVDIRVDLVQDGRRVLGTRLFGHARPLNGTTICRIAASRPLTLAATFPRILWQAGRLYYTKGLRVHSKPMPLAGAVIRQPGPTASQRFAMSVLFRFLSRMRRGRLIICLPGGSQRTFGDASSDECCVLRIHSYRFFSRTLRFGDVGFGESYTAGEWDCGNLPELIQLFIRNQDTLNDVDIRWTRFGRGVNALRHWLRRNSRRNSRRNIEAHYDLGNEFYRRFLDERMIYSSGIFESASESLESAQQRKIDRLLAMAEIQDGDHLLEIGSGWGALAIEAAKRFRCRVTGVTLSKEQLAESRERASRAGVADRVHFELRDYREIRGRFDRIVSVEMLEAVGHRYFGDFFRTCDRLVEPDGRVVLQTISIPDQRYEAYRRSSDWINKHIFPGGHLPSLAALTAAMTRHSSWVIDRLENIGPHYATTLVHWRQRFEAAADALKHQGFDAEFLRKWRYYLCYCEAAFATRSLNNLQLVLKRPGER